jgi:hypothetical protein
MQITGCFFFYYIISRRDTSEKHSFFGCFAKPGLTPSPMQLTMGTGSFMKLQIPPSRRQRGTRKMTILQKARMNLYEALESGKIEEILEASRKMDKLIVHQMGRQYCKKKAEVA